MELLRTRGEAIAAILPVAAAWLLLFRAPLATAAAMATAGSLALDAVVVAGLVVIARRRRTPVVLDARARPLPLLVAGVAALAHVLNVRTAQIDLASATLMIVGGWGLLGVWLPTRRWLQSAPLAIAGICALPIGGALDLWIGFPLRVATAHVTQGLLAPVLGGTLATETIIVVDGGAPGVQIDLPCSGVRSLYSGALFWAAASWIERTRIGARWLVASVAFVAILAATNLARVMMLVYLHVHAPRILADILHVPLGVAAFVIGCGLGWALLRRLPRSKAEQLEPARTGRAPSWPITAVLLVLALIPSATPTSDSPTALALAELDARPIAPSDAEARLFHARGADAVGKWDVAHGRVRGQLVIVRSRSWRAQHRPDVCHRASGRRIVDEHSAMIDAGFPIRALRLAGEGGEAWGLFWFQSATVITDDHGARVWSALDGDAERWVMVSLVLPGELALADPEVVALLQSIRNEAARLVRNDEEERS